jgi:hypothetical protein
MYAYCQGDPVNFCDPSGRKYDGLDEAVDNFSLIVSINMQTVKSFLSVLGNNKKNIYTMAAWLGFSGLGLKVVDNSVKLVDATFMNKDPYFGNLLFGTFRYTMDNKRKTPMSMDFVVGTAQDILDWISYTEYGNYSAAANAIEKFAGGAVGSLPGISILYGTLDFVLSISLKRFKSFVYESLAPHKKNANLLFFLPIRRYDSTPL